MEWNRIEKKWEEMTRRLQHEVSPSTRPGIVAPSPKGVPLPKAGVAPPKADTVAQRSPV